MSFLERAVGNNGRYTLEFRHKYGYGDGHIVSVFKEKGSIKIYDPQSGEIIKNAETIQKNSNNSMPKTIQDCYKIIYQTIG